MAQGLRIRNAAGTVVFDTSVRLGRILGSIIIPAGTSLSGSAYIPGLTEGNPFVVPIFNAGYQDGGVYNVGVECMPVFTFSGETASWSRSIYSQWYGGAGFAQVEVLVGVR